MRRLFLLIPVVFAMCGPAFAQGASSDPQTLQGILTEVRALRQDLRVSLARIQSVQILLSRLQVQQGAVARASEHLEDARSKLSEIQVRQREVAAEAKRLEDALGAEENLQQQKALQDRINHVKSDLEVTGDTEQQRQAAEIQAEQQLRAEQDKLTALETQLDERTRSMGNSVDQSGRNRP
jgi:chromosome segregation ATPase